MAEQSASQEKWERSPGFVYFIAAGDAPVAVKIGISTEVTLVDRFNTIKGSNHEPLRFLGVVPFRDSRRPMKDALSHEKELHKKFEKFQCTGAGSEWFIAALEIRDYIEKNATSLELAVPDSDRIWSKFQKNVSENDRKAVKSFHDDMVSSGYISVSKNTLQFRLPYKPDEPVMFIRIGTGSDMEINLTHSKSALLKGLIKKHVTLDNIQLNQKYPRVKLNDWRKHNHEFLTAFEQIAKEVSGHNNGHNKVKRSNL